ncbi:MAG: hypothetical protein LUH00_13005, partial [Lachnospiraceae bacterium]|nr:hypothetical protein [Lachnospiraceae bacterium]
GVQGRQLRCLRQAREHTAEPVLEKRALAYKEGSFAAYARRASTRQSRCSKKSALAYKEE